jgi:hypothetical protein
MLGHRGRLTAAEWDAFSRRSRGILNWRSGEIAKLKRAYVKRVRKAGSVMVRRELSERPD